MPRSLLLLEILLVGITLPPPDAPAPPAAPVPFGAATAAALADAKSLPPGAAAVTRYLDARHLAGDPDVLAEHYAAVSDAANKLSREGEIRRPRKVTPWLWAVDFRDYRWNETVWGELAKVNHYHLVPLKGAETPPVRKTRQVTKYDQYNRPYYATEEYTEPGAKAADTFAPMFGDDPGFAELVTLTGSATPVIRADDWLFQTAIQAGRKGHGYYDWFAFKKLEDIERFARLDRKGSEELYLDRAEMVPQSSVGGPEVDRLILFVKSLGGWWFETRDAKTKKEKANVTTQLLDDYKFDARMVVYRLPNGLPGFALSDAAGKLVDSAPDDIAADSESTNQDHRVHVGYSCSACHDRAGLKSFRPWSRKIYHPSTGARLATPDGIDDDLARRIRSAYLAPLEKQFAAAEADFAEA